MAGDFLIFIREDHVRVPAFVGAEFEIGRWVDLECVLLVICRPLAASPSQL